VVSDTRTALLDRDQHNPDLSVERYRSQREKEKQREEKWLLRYKNLEQLIFQGFLTLPVCIQDTRFVLKTINTVEFEKARLYLGLRQSDHIIHQLYFIAHSILMVNDVNVLQSRSESLPYIIKSLQTLPVSYLTRMVTLLTDLNNLSVKSGPLIEAYCYEDVSRQNWMSLKGYKLNDPMVSGVEGTQYIGLNTYQKLWVSLNNLEDIKIAREVDWDYAKFVGSCFNPKGVRNIEAHDKGRRAREREEREMIRKGVVEDDTIKIQANTVEELMDELERSLKGEKDWHDKVIEEYERKTTEDYRKQKESYLEIMEESPLSLEELQNLQDENPGKRVFSLDQAKESLEKRRQGVINSPAMQRMYEMSRSSKYINRLNPSINSDIVEGFEVETPNIGRK